MGATPSRPSNYNVENSSTSLQQKKKYSNDVHALIKDGYLTALEVEKQNDVNDTAIHCRYYAAANKKTGLSCE